MEAGTRCRQSFVDILFAHPLRLDDGEGQLRDCGSTVFCDFRCPARWIRFERDLHKTSLDRSCHDGIRHCFDHNFLMFLAVKRRALKL